MRQCRIPVSHTPSPQQHKGHLPGTGLSWLAVTSGSAAGAGELAPGRVKIPKHSLAALGLIPGCAMCFLGDFTSPHFHHLSGLAVEDFAQ